MGKCAYVQLGGNKNNKLVNDIFKNIIGKKPVIVLYFADWCGHCKSLKPSWNNVIDKLKMSKIKPDEVKDANKFNKYVIALEDGAYDKNECPDVDTNVRGFPTINYYPPKKAPLESFEEERDEEHLQKWISDKLDLGSVQSIPKQSGGNRRRRRRKTRKTKRRRKKRKTKRRRKKSKTKRRR
tara:strand:- start:14193 stop:14738 length:546 start_codon:yes stop_codon:yes gene_type:complete